MKSKVRTGAALLGGVAILGLGFGGVSDLLNTTMTTTSTAPCPVTAAPSSSNTPGDPPNCEEPEGPIPPSPITTTVHPRP